MKIRVENGRPISDSAAHFIPNLFTAGNLFLGTLAIYMVIHGDVFKAALCIMAATIMDVFDGRIARLTGSSSVFGAEFDSLSDLISFGLAPALLAYFWWFQNTGRVGWMAAFVFIACGALRLARYNTEVKDPTLEKNYFKGLPIPAAANWITTFALFCRYLSFTPPYPYVGVAILIVLALLMVSPIPFRSFKDIPFLSKKPFTQLIFIVIFMLVILIRWETNLFVGVNLYISINLFIYLAHLARRKKDADTRHTRQGTPL